jgi:hypothetical protein
MVFLMTNYYEFVYYTLDPSSPIMLELTSCDMKFVTLKAPEYSQMGTAVKHMLSVKK